MSDTIALPDVNVLIALSEPRHEHHNRAQMWFRRARDVGWATCPITELGFVRVVSSTSYPYLRFDPATAAAFLRDLISSFRSHYHFWPADASFTDDSLVDLALLRGHRQITDVYLLGLCQMHGGTLVTFDSALPTYVSSIVSARTDLVKVVP